RSRRSMHRVCRRTAERNRMAVARALLVRAATGRARPLELGGEGSVARRFGSVAPVPSSANFCYTETDRTPVLQRRNPRSIASHCVRRDDRIKIAQFSMIRTKAASIRGDLRRYRRSVRVAATAACGSVAVLAALTAAAAGQGAGG